MPFDSFYMYATVCQLNDCLSGARLEKVSQPERNELRLGLRGSGGTKTLLISASPGSEGLYLTDSKRTNPDVPPMFCMLLRKHLSRAKLLSITMQPPERVCVLNFLCFDEMGDETKKHLIFECIGRISNIILCDEQMGIIDCIKRINLDSGAARPVLPGLLYRFPAPPESKTNPLSVSKEEFFILLENSGVEAERFFSRKFWGLSPLLCRELALASAEPDKACSELSEKDKESLWYALSSLCNLLRKGGLKPYALEDKTGRIFDFSCIPIRQYGRLYTQMEYKTFSEPLDRFFSERYESARILSLRALILKPVSAAAAKLEKKLFIQREELKSSERREEYRKKADILSAFAFKIQKGVSKITLPNLYGQQGEEIEIKLDERLNAQQNVKEYYKKYARLKSAKAHLESLIAQGEKELLYLKNVLYEISAADEATLLELRAELSEYFPQKDRRAKHHKITPQKPMRFDVADGFTVLCGKTGRQNDELTFKTAHKSDLWLHVKNAPGSHVILLCNGRTPTSAAISEAAKIAATHSSLSDGKIPVDYTQVMHVKKIPGAKPGMVIYDKYKTIFI